MVLGRSRSRALAVQCLPAGGAVDPPGAARRIRRISGCLESGAQKTFRRTLGVKSQRTIVQSLREVPEGARFIAPTATSDATSTTCPRPKYESGAKVSGRRRRHQRNDPPLRAGCANTTAPDPRPNLRPRHHDASTTQCAPCARRPGPSRDSLPPAAVRPFERFPSTHDRAPVWSLEHEQVFCGYDCRT